MTIKCFECNMEHPNHKLDCNSKSRMHSLVWLLVSLHHIPQETLDEISFRIWTEQTERKFRDMFDEANPFEE